MLYQDLARPRFTFSSDSDFPDLSHTSPRNEARDSLELLTEAFTRFLQEKKESGLLATTDEAVTVPAGHHLTEMAAAIESGLSSDSQSEFYYSTHLGRGNWRAFSDFIQNPDSKLLLPALMSQFIRQQESISLLKSKLLAPAVSTITTVTAALARSILNADLEIKRLEPGVNITPKNYSAIAPTSFWHTHLPPNFSTLPSVEVDEIDITATFVPAGPQPVSAALAGDRPRGIPSFAEVSRKFPRSPDQQWTSEGIVHMADLLARQLCSCHTFLKGEEVPSGHVVLFGPGAIHRGALSVEEKDLKSVERTKEALAKGHPCPRAVVISTIVVKNPRHT